MARSEFEADELGADAFPDETRGQALSADAVSDVPDGSEIRALAPMSDIARRRFTK